MSAERDGPVIMLMARGSAPVPKRSPTRAHTASQSHAFGYPSLRQRTAADLLRALHFFRENTMKTFMWPVFFILLAGAGIGGAIANTLPNTCSSDSCAGAESALRREQQQSQERLAQIPQSPFAPTEEQKRQQEAEAKRQQAAETKRQAEEKRQQAKEKRQRAKEEQKQQADAERQRSSKAERQRQIEQRAKEKEEERRRYEERLGTPEMWEEMRRQEALQKEELRRYEERRRACLAECGRDRATLGQCIRDRCGL